MDSKLNEELEAIDVNIETMIGTNEQLLSRNAIVTPGEASESDEDEEQDIEHNEDNEQHMTNNGEKETIDYEADICEDKDSICDSIKYNSLLHKKLREKNEVLKRELADLACGPYKSATKEIANITKQLIQSQKLVQNVSATLRKVSKELFTLEESIDSIKVDKNILINHFIINSNNDISKEQIKEQKEYSSSSTTSSANQS